MAKKRVVRAVKAKKLKGMTKFKNAKSKIFKQKPSATRGIEEIRNEAITYNKAKTEVKKVVTKDLTPDELAERYPILKNEELVKKFLSVTITNNQKGRIRQLLRDSLKGASNVLLPDVIHNRIVAITKTTNLTDAELRKIRILYNMLKTSLQSEKIVKVKNNNKSNKQINEDNGANSDIVEDQEEIVTKGKKNKKESKEKINKDKGPNPDIVEDQKKEVTKEINNKNERNKQIYEENGSNSDIGDHDMKDTSTNEVNEVITLEREVSDTKDVKVKKDMNKGKMKGPKRYVVFVGNLPLDINKEQIMTHFLDIGDNIVDIRIPEQLEGKNNRIAYVELKDEPTFEMALSKNHSMLGNKRINVAYTTQKKSKISKSEAKGKAEKLKALQKSGKLIGSISSSKKRSNRRMKMMAARKAQEAQN